MDTETRKAALGEARAWLDARGRSGASLAGELGKSAGWVNRILRGDWPYRGSWQWPRYFGVWLARQGLHPEGRLRGYVLVDETGEVLMDGQGNVYSVKETEAGAARRNERFSADGKTVRWVARPEATDPNAPAVP